MLDTTLSGLLCNLFLFSIIIPALQALNHQLISLEFRRDAIIIAPKKKKYKPVICFTINNHRSFQALNHQLIWPVILKACNYYRVIGISFESILPNDIKLYYCPAKNCQY
jgi:hypothetical protein